MPRFQKKRKGVKRAYKRPIVRRRNARKGKSIVRVKSLVIPRSQFIKIVDNFTGYVAAAAVTSGYATIYGMQLQAPYNSGIPITGSTFGTLVPTSGASVTDNFSGYSIIASQYNQYRCYGAKLTVFCRPEGTSDTIQLGVFPWAVTNQNTITSMTVDEWTEQPYCRNKVVYSNVAGDRVVSSVRPSTVLGMSKLQYKVQPSNAITATTVSSPTISSVNNWNFFVFWKTVDNANLASNLIFTFKLERFIQFTNPNQLSN